MGGFLMGSHPSALQMAPSAAGLTQSDEAPQNLLPQLDYQLYPVRPDSAQLHWVPHTSMTKSRLEPDSISDTQEQKRREMKTAVMPNREGSAPKWAEAMRWVCTGEMRSLPGGTDRAPWMVQNLRDIMDKQGFCSKGSRFESEAQAEFCVSRSRSLRTSVLRLHASWWLLCYQIRSGFFQCHASPYLWAG